MESPAWLDLTDNQLTGPLPSAWGQLAHLEILDLAGNRLTGPLPPAWGQLASLRWLNLGNNQLTGCYARSYKGHISTDLPACPTPPVDQDVSRG